MRKGASESIERIITENEHYVYFNGSALMTSYTSYLNGKKYLLKTRLNSIKVCTYSMDWFLASNPVGVLPLLLSSHMIPIPEKFTLYPNKNLICFDINGVTTAFRLAEDQHMDEHHALTLGVNGFELLREDTSSFRGLLRSRYAVK